MEEAVVTHLLAASGLTALVSNRITWSERPQASALPAVVLQRIDGIRDYSMDGPTGLVSSRIQADCWGLSYGSAKMTARAVEAALSGIDTTVTDGGSPAVTLATLRGGFVQDEQDGKETGAGAVDLYRTRLDFIIWHR